jgi:hypothetical protein
MTMIFIKWLENKKAQEESSKDIILTFLREKLNIKSSSKIMDLNTKDLEDDVKEDLLGRGIIKDSDYIKERIKNGVSIRTLIKLIAEY